MELSFSVFNADERSIFTRLTSGGGEELESTESPESVTAPADLYADQAAGEETESVETESSIVTASQIAFKYLEQELELAKQENAFMKKENALIKEENALLKNHCELQTAEIEHVRQTVATLYQQVEKYKKDQRNLDVLEKDHSSMLQQRQIAWMRENQTKGLLEQNKVELEKYRVEAEYYKRQLQIFQQQYTASSMTQESFLPHDVSQSVFQSPTYTLMQNIRSSESRVPVQQNNNMYSPF